MVMYLKGNDLSLALLITFLIILKPFFKRHNSMAHVWIIESTEKYDTH